MGSGDGMSGTDLPFFDYKGLGGNDSTPVTNALNEEDLCLDDHSCPVNDGNDNDLGFRYPFHNQPGDDLLIYSPVRGTFPLHATENNLEDDQFKLFPEIE
jgi:hypothetical protein